MKHFTLKIAGLETVDLGKFSCRKVSTAQAHASKLVTARGTILNMVNGACLDCGDGQSWIDIGQGFKRMSKRSAWTVNSYAAD